MRHRVPRHHLSRPADQRKALLRGLATELLRHDEIETSLAKAKAVRGEVERLIAIAKRGQLENHHELYAKAKAGDLDAANKIARAVHLRRQVASYIYEGTVYNEEGKPEKENLVKRVFDVVAPRYKNREGGFTRIQRNGFRRGDATPMAIIQLV
jgi:large subunit ribosomal protein L17